MADLTEQTILVQLPVAELERVEGAARKVVGDFGPIEWFYGFTPGDDDGYETGVVLGIQADANLAEVIDQFCLQLSEAVGANACSEHAFDAAQAKAEQSA